MLCRKICATCLSCILLTSLFGQELTSIQNNNPPSIRWSQINTPDFRLIFPAGFDAQAQRVANTLDHIHDENSVTMGVKPKKISILLQNQTSVANGFVSLAPRRSEFFTMPPQSYNNAGANDWLTLLTVHEYRHVAQYQRSIVGFSKFVYYAFGQQALSLMTFTAVPQWLWEGDAVATETALTSSGRGRIPEFGLVFRTNLVEGRRFNYEKQYLRSYRHNVPDHYVLGYHMISHLRKRTNDPLIWEKVGRRAWSWPFMPFTFSRAIKKEAGLSVDGLYREMADSLTNLWTKQIESVKKTVFKPVNNRKKKYFIDYLYPQPQDDGSVIVMKSGIGDTPQLVVLREGNETKRFIIGPQPESGMLSAMGGKVVWNEYRYDPRWRMRNYSVIRTYDVHTGRSNTLTSKSRYGSAALSPDGSMIATIESKVDYSQRLTVIDAQNGTVRKTFDNPDSHLLSMPRWSNDGKAILTVALTGSGKKILRFDFNAETSKSLFDAGSENIGHPVLHDNYLFYNSPYSGIDNIYVIDTATGQKYQVTSSLYGAYNPAISHDGDWIYYNEHTLNGQDVVRVAFEPSFWTPIEQVTQPVTNTYQHLVEQEGHADILAGVPNNKFPVTPYSKAKSLINPHSWGPYFNTSITNAELGITSRDLLGTTVINAGYTFDINERTGNFRAGVSYQGLYPIIDAEGTFGNRRETAAASVRNEDDEVIPLNINFVWKETGASLGFRVPLVLTRSKYVSGVSLQSVAGLTNVVGFRHQIVNSSTNVLLRSAPGRNVRLGDSFSFLYDYYVGNGILLYNRSSISLTRYLLTSRRDLNPKFGQALDFELYSTPFGGDYQGYQAAVRSTLYFPGLKKHHSVFLRGGYQLGTSGNETNRYSFRNRIFKPRGFRYPRDSEFMSWSVNYTLPVVYPDFALGPLANFQRIRANAFYDGGYGVGTMHYYSDNGAIEPRSTNAKYHSAGLELTVDMNVLRLLPQLDVGVRFTRGISRKEDLMVEFLLGTLNL